MFFDIRMRASSSRYQMHAVFCFPFLKWTDVYFMLYAVIFQYMDWLCTDVFSLFLV